MRKSKPEWWRPKMEDCLEAFLGLLSVIGQQPSASMIFEAGAIWQSHREKTDA